MDAPADAPMAPMDVETETRQDRVESQEMVDTNTTTTDRKITLRCSDGELKNVLADVVTKSKLIAGMLEADDEADDGTAISTTVIPLNGISKETMAKIYEWMQYHHDPAHPVPTVVKPIKSASMKENIKDYQWDAEWVDALEANQEQMFAVVLGANYLDCEPLLDLGCAKIASLLKNRTPKEIRAYFKIPEPSPEEEEQIRKDNAWIFEIRPSDAEGGAAGAAGGGAAA